MPPLLFHEDFYYNHSLVKCAFNLTEIMTRTTQAITRHYNILEHGKARDKRKMRSILKTS